MTLDEILALYANGIDPIADGDGWLASCPLCAKLELRFAQKPKTISVLCRVGCRTIDILQVKGLSHADLKVGNNGHKPPGAPPPNAPQSQAQTNSGKTYNTTDMGNAERFIDLHGANVRYCSQLGKDGHWLIWDSRRWKVDYTLRIHALAKEVVPMIYADIANAATAKERKRLFTWAVHTEGLAARNNMIKDSRPMVAIEVSELDQDRWLLNVANGTLDLRTGNLAAHAQSDKLTKLINVDFDPNAECSQWEAFLNECMANNQHLVSYLQKTVGYSLTGDVSEKAIFIMHGPTNTGKTTFIETVSALIGEYAAKIQTQTLMWQRERNNTNDIARLKGARFVYACESEESERLAEGRLKEISGGDTITARFLHAEFFEYDPEFKVWLATNHKPRVSNDPATWDRLKLIPFVVPVPEDRKDKKLKQKLRSELSGILRWAIDGCLMWQRDGLRHPDDVIAATKDYRNQMDVIGMFIDECCDIGEFFRVTSRDLYDAYKRWSADSGEYTESQRALGLKLRDRDLTNEMITSGQQKGRTEWVGIRLK